VLAAATAPFLFPKRCDLVCHSTAGSITAVPNFSKKIKEEKNCGSHKHNCTRDYGGAYVCSSKPAISSI
jgi:hypothetical protein